ncbi:MULTISPECIES: tetratricopeptide repeat protein [Chryseobacterium]|uniref:tetratricopeptide repeat-containing sensor histidine kinase n=1 Tax=Chryseobacterium TaxID=59732 RepID=UPI00162AC580|nr:MULTISPECIES: tetratricopeptide repeat protein [Chryseobacterium]MDM1554087.1 tetratricopeptide repeat protein [Chryseobacterium indologenes]
MKKSIFLLLVLIIVSCKKNNVNEGINVNFKKATIYRDSKSSDSAFYYFNLAKNDYLTIHDSIGAARSLANMAIIQTEKGDFFGGIEASLESNKAIKPEHSDSLSKKIMAANYNNMAIASNYLKNYENAFNYYLQALKYINQKDTISKYIYYNNIGDVLITLGQYKNAQNYLNEAIKTKDTLTYARALNNLAKAKYIGNKDYNPLPELLKALEIRRISNDKKGQNSSFETLSSYYLDKDPNTSLLFAKKMLAVAEEDNSPDDQILALERIITLEPINYLKNFQKLKYINDSLQTARNQAKNQFAIIRFDVEKLKMENTKKEIDLLRRNIGIATLSLSLIGGMFWYRRRKKRLQQEKEIEIKNTQLKMSKKVHDVVANGIYQVMTKIENQENFDKNKALDELEFVYEKSRDISYEKADTIDNVEFAEKIFHLIDSFKSDYIKPFLTGNSQYIWIGVNETTQNEVFQVIRELLVNMKKHSQASLVVFKFEKNNNLIHIQYKDNGIGIPGEIIHGNGLSNTVSRIEKIKGTIIFDNTTEKGLKVNISFPTS